MADLTGNGEEEEASEVDDGEGEAEGAW